MFKIYSTPERRDEILDILFSVKGPTQREAGCLGVNIHRDIDDDQVIIYEEFWRNDECFYEHVRSDLYRSLLMAMDLSARHPDIQFHFVMKTAGMELLRDILTETEASGQNRISINGSLTTARQASRSTHGGTICRSGKRTSF